MKTNRDIAYSINHVKERLWQRYNLDISSTDYMDMCLQVKNKINVEFITEEKQKDDLQQIYDIIYKGIPVRVVWSVNKQYIKTVLPV